MVLDLTPEQEAHLNQIAQHEGKAPAQLLIERALSLLDDRESFRRAVQQGLAEADAGDFVEEDEVDARFKRMMQRG